MRKNDIYFPPKKMDQPTRPAGQPDPTRRFSRLGSGWPFFTGPKKIFTHIFLSSYRSE